MRPLSSYTNYRVPADPSTGLGRGHQLGRARGAAGRVGSAAAASTAAAHRAAPDRLGTYCLCPGDVGKHAATTVTCLLLIYLLFFDIYLFIQMKNLYN